MRIILIRHTKSKQSIKALLKDDDSNGGLSQLGVAQAHNLKHLFKNEEERKIFVSPAKRCLQTAKLIFPQQEKEFIISPELREINKGFLKEIKKNSKLGLMTVQEWELKYNNSNKPQIKIQYKYPSGESVIEMINRVNNFFKQLVQGETCPELVIISHNGPIKGIISSVLNNPELYSLIACDSGCYSELECRQGSFIVKKLNSM